MSKGRQSNKCWEGFGSSGGTKDIFKKSCRNRNLGSNECFFRNSSKLAASVRIWPRFEFPTAFALTYATLAKRYNTAMTPIDKGRANLSVR